MWSRDADYDFTVETNTIVGFCGMKMDVAIDNNDSMFEHRSSKAWHISGASLLLLCQHSISVSHRLQFVARTTMWSFVGFSASGMNKKGLEEDGCCHHQYGGQDDGCLQTDQ